MRRSCSQTLLWPPIDFTRFARRCLAGFPEGLAFVIDEVTAADRRLGCFATLACRSC